MCTAAFPVDHSRWPLWRTPQVAGCNAGDWPDVLRDVIGKQVSAACCRRYALWLKAQETPQTLSSSVWHCFCLAAPMNARPRPCLALLLQTPGRHPALRRNGMTLPVNNMVSIPAANNSRTAWNMLGPDGQILLVHRRAKQHANVRFWPISDIANCAAHVRLWPKAEMWSLGMVAGYPLPF